MGAAASLNEDDSILTYLSTRLIYPVAADDTPPYERIAWWKIQMVGVVIMDCTLHTGSSSSIFHPSCILFNH